MGMSAITLPEIVCHDCPAVVEVLCVERCEWDDRIVIGVRCHGQTAIYRADTELVLSGTSVGLHQLRRFDCDGLLANVSEYEDRVRVLLQRARLYRDVLRQSGVVPKNRETSRIRYIELAEEFMNYAESFK